MINITLDQNTELRQLQTSDAEELFELTNRNREYLKEWLPWLNSVQTVNDTFHFIGETLEKFNINKAFDVGIWYKNQLVGTIGLHEIKWDKHQTAIGYWLGSDYQGLGLMTKSCKAIISYTFEQYNVQKIYVRCAPENIKSRSIPLRLKLTEVETIINAEILYGRLVDNVVYLITHEEYLQRISEFKIYS